MSPRGARGALAAAVTVLVLAGCAPADLEATRAQLLQDDVRAVTQAASEGRLDAAAVLLQQLRVAVDDARDDGDVSAARYTEVSAALDAVAAQLDADLAAQAAAAEAEAAAVRQAAVDAAVAEVTAREAAAREAAA
ncbi:hypothetical protein, partial [Cellulomonas shaoxiangyii]